MEFDNPRVEYKFSTYRQSRKSLNPESSPDIKGKRRHSDRQTGDASSPRTSKFVQHASRRSTRTMSTRRMNEVFRRMTSAYVDTDTLRRMAAENQLRKRKSIRKKMQRVEAAAQRKPRESEELVKDVGDLLMEYAEEESSCLPNYYDSSWDSVCGPKKKPPFQIPFHILIKYPKLKLPRSLRMMHRLLRPLVFLDVELMGVRRLGRIVVELYTEACPQVVLEFVRTCSKKQHDLFRFARSFPLLWMEAEMRSPNLSPQCLPDMEYDMRALDHASGCGILSFGARYTDGFPNGVLKFSLSYNSLPAINGSRVAFGVVVSGLKVLGFMQEFALHHEECMKNVVITEVGLIPR